MIWHIFVTRFRLASLTFFVYRRFRSNQNLFEIAITPEKANHRLYVGVFMYDTKLTMIDRWRAEFPCTQKSIFFSNRYTRP
jgi:hypothetical protein